MTKSKVFRVVFVLLVLIIIVPVILYVSAIDLSKSYTKRFESIETYHDSIKEGIYKVNANDLIFKARITGFENTGENVIFLHGFPQTSSIWEPAMMIVKDYNYRLAAYDQRGYSPGARPEGKEKYDIDLLVKDLLSIADQLEFETFHLVGHDWGASVGWKAVMDYPDRITSWTALSIPHTGVFIDGFKNNVEQKEKSSYISQLQKPILPEFLFVLNKEKMMENVRGIWREEEIEDVSALLSEHGALTAVLNWYRAADMLNELSDRFYKKVHVPTLYIWGNKDHVLAPSIIPNQKEFMANFYKEVELNAGHSLIQEKRDTIIPLLLEHWGRSKKE